MSAQSGLPEPFSYLEGIACWAPATESGRMRKRLASSMPEIEAFYRADALAGLFDIQEARRLPSRAAGRGRDARVQTLRPRAAATTIAGPNTARLTADIDPRRMDARLA